jgi:hypothetical protein
MKNSSTCFGESSSQILFRDSTAYGVLETQPTCVGAGGQGYSTHLVPDYGLFYSREILKRREQYMTKRRTANVFDEIAKLGA